jgi:N12 class adenine-specific DNA methylase
MSENQQPSKDQLLNALEKAHLAGDTEGAKELARWHNEIYQPQPEPEIAQEGPGLPPLNLQPDTGSKIADAGRRGPDPSIGPANDPATSLTAEEMAATPQPSDQSTVANTSEQVALNRNLLKEQFPEQYESPSASPARSTPGKPEQESPSFNAARGAVERSGDLAAGLGTSINTAAQAAEDKFGVGGLVWDGEGLIPKYLNAQDYSDFLAEGGSDLGAVATDNLKNIDAGYVPENTWESVKAEFSEGGVFSASAYGEVLAYGFEQGIKSVPDMVAVTLSLPAYVIARSGEIGETRAQNKGKEKAELTDIVEAAPFALGSAILERIGARGITQAGAEAFGAAALKRGVKAAAKRIAAAGGSATLRESGTEFVQEGILEYLGERFGTDAKLDVAEAFDRGLAGLVAGGTFGGAVGTSVATGREIARPSQAAELGQALNEGVDNAEFVPADQAVTDSLDPSRAQVEQTQASQRPSMAELVSQKMKERGFDFTPRPGQMPPGINVPFQPAQSQQQEQTVPVETERQQNTEQREKEIVPEESQTLDVYAEVQSNGSYTVLTTPAGQPLDVSPAQNARIEPVATSVPIEAHRSLKTNAGRESVETLKRSYKNAEVSGQPVTGNKDRSRKITEQTKNAEKGEVGGTVGSKAIINGPTERISLDSTLSRTGKPMRATGYRVDGIDPNKLYSGAQVPILGDGVYVAPTEQDAKSFSGEDNSVIAEQEVNLKNPLVINSDSEWRALTKEAGWQSPNPFGQSEADTQKAVDDLRAILAARGHDGVAVLWNDDTIYDFDAKTGNRIKTLRSVFSKPQVVQFNNAKSEVPIVRREQTTLKETIEEAATNEPTELGEQGPDSLAGESAEVLPEPEGAGNTGADAETGSGTNVPAGGRAGASRVPAGRGVPDGTGEIPVSPGRTGERADGQQRAGDPGQRATDNEPDTGSGEPATRGSEGNVDATEKAAKEAPTPKGATTQRSEPAGERPAKFFTLTPEMNIGAGGAKTKFKNNLKAIQTLKQLSEEGRQATPEEQQILAGYVGFGGIPQAFVGDGGKITKGWEKETKQLQEALTDAEYDAARRSTQDAHYTSPEIVSEMWNAVKNMGFQGGRVLEPSVGTGNFLGFMPGGVRSKSSIAGVELDHITGGIAQKLYPGANIQAPLGFQEFTMPDNYFDLAIGNPPFGSQKLYDGKRKSLSKMSIHNYFFAKSMAGLKPNGVLAMVVSSRLMDGGNKMARDYLADRADLLGAVRMPNNAFLKNAGTEVTTDIIFMRKRAEGEQATGDSWSVVNTVQDAKGIDVPLNEYYSKNPAMMLGEWGAYGSMYGPNDPALVAREGQDTNALLREALASLPKGFMTKAGADVVTEDVQLPTSIENVKVGSMFIDGGQISIRLESEMGKARSEAIDVPSKKAEERVRGLIKVRDVFADLRKAQLTDNVKDEALAALRDRLNRTYDQFVSKNGPINLDANKRLFRDDPTWPQLAALEESFDKGISATVAKRTGETSRIPSAKKAAIFRTRTQQPYKAPDKASTAKDSLTASLSEKGQVDMAYMSQLYGKTESAIVDELGDLIFESTPNNWESRDEYLSGNVKNKLAMAERMAKDTPRLQRNVAALKEIQPEDIEAVDIRVKLGAHWLPTEVVTAFANLILGNETGKATYNPVMAKWSIRGGARDAAATQYGTDRAEVKDVLTAAANEKSLVIRDSIGDGKTVLNESATNAANEKVNRVKAEFRRWVWSDDARRERLIRLYNDTFNTDRVREYDGSHLTFPGKVSDDIIKLRPHQANAAWRIVQSGTTLLDQVVGSGKTFTMIAGSMELRRTGRAKKPMFVVPNHLVGQWAEDFTKLYPNANILAATKRDFEKGNRKRLFARISTGDWDAVIVAHSSFGKVEMDAEFQERFINQQIRDIDTAIATIRDQDGKDSRSIKQIEKQKERLQERLKRLFDSENKDDNLTFSELGVDALFLDEAHEFKNLGFATGMTRVAGLGDPKGSQKAADMFMKVQSILERTGGNNVIFATGTPISNTMAEMYTVQRFLDYQTLQDQGIAHFDAWARMYGEVITDWELSPTGSYKLNSRFSKFVNLPELMQRYLTFADVINRDDINRQLAAMGKRLPVPKIKGGKPNNIIVDRSEDQADYIGVAVKDERGNESYPRGSLVYRAENLPKKPEKGQDNMLKIMSDARKAALDMRLIDPTLYGDNPASKINEAAGRIKTIYDKWTDDKGAQLVFIDLSTPKAAKTREANRIRDLIQRSENGEDAATEQLDNMSPDELEALNSDFSVYDDLRQKLINLGIAESEIEFIHSANTDIQKAELFAKVRTGRVRVMLGSTAKMGAGMNVQTRLVALHHMDAPWRPSDLEQREGRIIRQGNVLYDRDPNGFEIEINRYATKQTLDSRMWQTIETKARFIEQVRKGNSSAREVEDLGIESSNAAEMKAASSGNPLVLEEMDLRQKVRKLEQAEEEHDREQFRVRDAIRREKSIVERGKKRLLQFAQDVKKAKDAPKDFSMTVNGKKFDKNKDAGQQILAEAAKMAKSGVESKAIGSYSGFSMTLENIDGTRFVISLQGAQEYQANIQNIEEADATGVSRRVTNAILSIDGSAKETAANVRFAEKDLPQLEAQVKEWEQAEELAKAKSRHQLVIAELQPKKKESQEGEVDSDISSMATPIDSPMPQWQPTYRILGVSPRRPESGIITVGDRNVRLKQEDAPTRREGIRTMVIDLIGTRLYQQKIKGKSKLGFYRKSNSEVRIANFDDVEVMAHELAHFLDMHYSFNERFTRAYRDPRYLEEVQALSYTSKDKLKTTEGFAEFVRLWLTQYSEAKSRAPLFTQKFETVLSNDKPLQKKLTNMQEEMHRWFGQGELAQLYAATSGNQYTKAQQLSLMIARRPGQMWRQQYIDKIHAAKVMGRTLNGDMRTASEDAYKQLQLLNGIEGISQESFKHGAMVINENGDITFKGPSLRDVWSKSLKSGPKVVREQELYWAARRAKELAGQGRENRISKGMIDEGLALARKHPHFVQAFSDYQEYRKNMMEFYVDSGYVTPDAAKAMLNRNRNYVPFHRVVESVNDTYTAGSGFQRLKGGQQNIKPIFDNTMMQEQRHMYAALKARALRSLYEDALNSQDNVFLSKIGPDSKPVRAALDQMVSKTAGAMADLGITISEDGVFTGDGETIVDKADIEAYYEKNSEELMFWTFGHKPKTSETMVDSFIDRRGKRVWIEIQKENELLVDMLDGMDNVALPKGSLGTAVKFAMAVKKFQTLTITSMAQFAGPNAVRDAQQAFVLSGGKFVPVWDTMKGFGAQLHALVSSKSALSEMRAQGGPVAGRVGTFYNDNWGLASDSPAAPRTPFFYPTQWASSVLDIYMAIVDSFEIATRVGFYLRMRPTVGAREAAWQAREISTDFRKHGTYAPWVLLQRTVPFLGAYVQSVDRDIRALAENKGEMKLANLVKTESGRATLADMKVRIWLAGSLIIAVTAVLALLNDDDDRYRALAPDQKVRFYHFFIGGRHYTLPKGHGFIQLIGQGTESAIDVIGQQESKAAQKTMAFAVAYHFGMDATPGIINPVAEIALNRTFTGAPVVSRYAKDREPRYQYDDRTPLIYVNVGRELNISPDKAHHLMRGYTGYLSDFIDEASENMLWDNTAWGERPFARDFAKMAGKQFNPRDVPYRTKWTVGYYELRQRAATAQANLSFLGKEQAIRDQEPLKNFASNEVNASLVAINKVFSQIDSAFSNQGEVIASIKYNPELSAKEKEKDIESWYAQKNEVMKDVYQQVVKEIEKVEAKVSQ